MILKEPTSAVADDSGPSNAWGPQKLLIRKQDGTPLSREEATALADDYVDHSYASMLKGVKFAKVSAWNRLPHALEIRISNTRDMVEIRRGFTARGFLCQTEAEFWQSMGAGL